MARVGCVVVLDLRLMMSRCGEMKEIRDARRFTKGSYFNLAEQNMGCAKVEPNGIFVD